MNTTDDTPQAKYHRSREYLAATVTQWLDEHDRTTFDFGYDQGFHAGWDAAVRRLTQRPEPEPPPSTLDTVRSIGEGDQSAKEVVLSIIQKQPGLRGREIVDETSKSANPLHERTVRTALHRLKVARLIKIIDGKWYLNTSQLGEEPSE